MIEDTVVSIMFDIIIYILLFILSLLTVFDFIIALFLSISICFVSLYSIYLISLDICLSIVFLLQGPPLRNDYKVLAAPTPHYLTRQLYTHLTGYEVVTLPGGRPCLHS